MQRRAKAGSATRKASISAIPALIAPGQSSACSKPCAIRPRSSSITVSKAAAKHSSLLAKCS